MEKPNQSVNTLFFLSALPVFWFLGVLLLYIQAGLHLGHWPRVNLDDPKGLPFGFQYIVLVGGMFVVYGASALLPFIWIFQFPAYPRKTLKQILIFILGWMLIITPIVLAPDANWIDWFLD